ncbi:MAG: hypothetical protein RIB84_23740 [Sneathiellaceae bacterium]
MNAPDRRPGAAVWPYAGTASGRFVSLVAPAPAQISIRDIAHHLALQCRWAGATAAHYSIAQHSVLVAELLPPDPRLRALGLLHDAHEFVTGDICTPMKQAIGVRSDIERLPRIQARLDTAIHIACGLDNPYPGDEGPAIAAADRAMLWAEARDLCHPALTAVIHGEFRVPDPVPGRIKPWPWPEAEARFLAAAARYLPTCPE